MGDDFIKVIPLYHMLKAVDVIKDPQGPGPAPLPPNATEAEKVAHKAATDAMRRQRSAGTASEGRGSTILTGGKLGELGQYAGQAKGLLGL